MTRYICRQHVPTHTCKDKQAHLQYTLTLKRGQREIMPLLTTELAGRRMCHTHAAFDIDKPLRRLTSCQTFTNT